MFIGVSIIQILMLLAGSIFTLMWIFLYFKYNTEFDSLIKPIGKNEFFMSEIFFIGFGVMRLINYNLKSSRAKKATKKIAEIRGSIYADYYYYIITGGKFTYIVTLIPISFFVGALTKDIYIFFMALITIAALIYYLDFEIDNAVLKRKDGLLNDFPRVLSKLALLLNAGVTLRAAWLNVSNSDEGILYREMKLTSDDIANGTTEVEAYRDFAERCNVKEIRKFASVLIQNIQKGNKEITNLIKEMAEDSWQQKKYNVKIKGELASSKLMLPVGIMLVAIMIMIIVPIFSSL